MKDKRKPAAEKLDRSVSCAVIAVNIKGTAIRMITIKTINIRTRKTIFKIKVENMKFMQIGYMSSKGLNI